MAKVKIDIQAELDIVLDTLRRIGKCRAITAVYNALMMSDHCDVDGKFLYMYKAHALRFKVLGKKIGPGVYSLELERFNEVKASIDHKLSHCTYRPAYTSCNALGYPYCDSHKEKKCRCGQQATHECCYTGSYFVCGQPLCNQCTCHK